MGKLELLRSSHGFGRDLVHLSVQLSGIQEVSLLLESLSSFK